MSIDPWIGRVVGRYRIERKLGAGGMGSVYLARQDGPGGFSRTVALKLVSGSGSDDGLADEARVAALLRHPHIVPIIELGELDDGFYLAMEHVEGSSLQAIAQRSANAGLLPDRAALVDLGLQVLDALAYAWEAPGKDGPLRVVHRDIKPSNLLVDPHGFVKVVDFGIARATVVESRTASGVGKGTPAYMAPEQLKAEPMGPTTDAYALAAVLWELATGERLYDGVSWIQLMTRRSVGYTDEDAAKLAGAQPELAPILGRALRQEPDARWADAAALAEQLGAVEPASRGGLKAWVRRLDAAPEPTPETTERTAAVAWAPAPAGDPSRSTTPQWQPGEPSDTEPVPPAVGPTVLVSPADDPDASLIGDEVQAPPPKRPWAALVGVAALLALAGVGLLGGQRAAPEPTPTAVAAAPTAAPVAPEPTPAAVATPTPEPPAAESTPAPVAAVVPGGTPRPTPRSTPATTPSPTPEPTPEPTPAAEPTPEVAPAVAAQARGTVFVSLNPAGIARLAGTRHETPHRFRVEPGVHPLELLDKEGRRLGTYRLEVRSGTTSRCAFRMTDGSLTAMSDPREPCRLQ